jgi:hypothetical protein
MKSTEPIGIYKKCKEQPMIVNDLFFKRANTKSDAIR